MERSARSMAQSVSLYVCICVYLSVCFCAWLLLFLCQSVLMPVSSVLIEMIASNGMRGVIDGKRCTGGSFEFVSVCLCLSVCHSVWLCAVVTEAVARIQDIIDGKNLHRDLRASKPSSLAWPVPASSSSVGGISTSVSFSFC